VLFCIGALLYCFAKKYHQASLLQWILQYPEVLCVLKNSGIIINSHNGKNILLRHNSDDPLMYRDVLTNKEYLPLTTVGVDPQSVRVIIDAGANVGYASIFFADIFPHAIIYAIEPEYKNFKMLQANIRLAKLSHRIKPYLGALMPNDGSVKCVMGYRGFQECSVMVRPVDASAEAVTSWCFDSFLTLIKEDAVDILKVDIEGAEFGIFEEYKNAAPIFQKTTSIAVEIHHGLGDHQKVISNFIAEGYHLTNASQTLFATRPECINTPPLLPKILTTDSL
jgi:FkbM family methyltransferase